MNQINITRRRLLQGAGVLGTSAAMEGLLPSYARAAAALASPANSAKPDAVAQTLQTSSRPSTASSSLAPLEWTSIGVGAGGMVQELTAAPSRPDRMYAGVDVGGLYISDDGGLKWRPIYASLSRLANHAVRPYCIRVSHQDPDVFYFVAEAGPFSSRDGGRTYRRIGEFIHESNNGQSLCINPANDRDCVFFYGGRFLHTRDGGETLESLPPPPDFKGANSGQAFYMPGSIHPILIIGNGDKWFRSLDDGVTWVPLAMEGWPVGPPTYQPVRGVSLQVSFDRTAEKPLLTMPSSKEAGHVYRSTDLGDHWFTLLVPMEQGKPISQSSQLAVFPHPSDPSAYALTSYPMPNFITWDGGTTWSQPTGAAGESGLDDNNGGSEDGRPIQAIAVYFPLDLPDRVFVTNMFQIQRSDDGGKTFSLVTSRILGQPNHYMSTGIEGTYVNCYAADPNTGYRYMSDDDCGVYRSEDFDRSWFMLQKITTEPRDSGHIQAGKAIWNVSATSTILVDAAFKPSRVLAWFNNGLTIQPEALLGSLKNRVSMYAYNQGWQRSGIYVSDNNGADFKPVSDYKTFPHKWSGLTDAMVMDPHSPANQRTFGLAVAGGVFKSTDGGRNWSCLTEHINKSLGSTLPAYDDYEAWETQEWVFGRVRLSPTDGNTVYVHLMRRSGKTSQPLAAIIKSTDSGQTWTKLDSPVKSCSAFEISPFDSKRLYAACVEQGIFISEDGGKTWDQRFQQDPARGMIVSIWPSRRHPDLLYFGVDSIYKWQPQAGVFRSADNGRTWLDVTGSIPHLRIMSVKEDDFDPRYVFAGTNGGGGFIAFDRLPLPAK